MCGPVSNPAFDWLKTIACHPKVKPRRPVIALGAAWRVSPTRWRSPPRWQHALDPLDAAFGEVTAFRDARTLTNVIMQN
jgi:hypothetical protein